MRCCAPGEADNSASKCSWTTSCCTGGGTARWSRSATSGTARTRWPARSARPPVGPPSTLLQRCMPPSLPSAHKMPWSLQMHTVNLICPAFGERRRLEVLSCSSNLDLCQYGMLGSDAPGECSGVSIQHYYSTAPPKATTEDVNLDEMSAQSADSGGSGPGLKEVLHPPSGLYRLLPAWVKVVARSSTSLDGGRGKWRSRGGTDCVFSAFYISLRWLLLGRQCGVAADLHGTSSDHEGLRSLLGAQQRQWGIYHTGGYLFLWPHMEAC